MNGLDFFVKFSGEKFSWHILQKLPYTINLHYENSKNVLVKELIELRRIPLQFVKPKVSSFSMFLYRTVPCQCINVWNKYSDNFIDITSSDCDRIWLVTNFNSGNNDVKDYSSLANINSHLVLTCQISVLRFSFSHIRLFSNNSGDSNNNLEHIYCYDNVWKWKSLR